MEGSLGSSDFSAGFFPLGFSQVPLEFRKFRRDFAHIFPHILLPKQKPWSSCVALTEKTPVSMIFIHLHFSRGVGFPWGPWSAHHCRCGSRTRLFHWKVPPRKLTLTMAKTNMNEDVFRKYSKRWIFQPVMLFFFLGVVNLHYGSMFHWTVELIKRGQETQIFKSFPTRCKHMANHPAATGRCLWTIYGEKVKDQNRPKSPRASRPSQPRHGTLGEIIQKDPKGSPKG